MSCEELTRRMDALHVTHLKELYRLSSHITTPGEDGLLLCLYASDRPMLSGELVERMGLTTGRVANILKMLEAKGLVDREQDRQDRRKVHIALTPAGQARAEARFREASDAHRGLLEHLGEEDSARLLDLLERCLEYLGD